MERTSKETRLRPSARRQLSRWQRERSRQRAAIVTGAFIVLLVLALPVYGYVTTFIAPPRQWVVRVNEKTFTLGYLVKLLRMSQQGPQSQALGTLPFQLIDLLAQNELIKQGAPRYNITVAQDELDKEIRERILGTPGEGSQTPPEQLEREFQERYRQYLNLIRLSAGEHRQVVLYDVYREKLREVLGQGVPTVLPQVHLYSIEVENQARAEEVRRQYERGTPFAKLVGQFSADPEAVRKDGEVGWVPRGVFLDLDETIFSLEPGKLSQVIARSDPAGGRQETYIFYLVQEKSEAREVDPGNREILKTRALEKWVQQERERNRVETSFDSDKYAWVIKQLRISQPAQPQP